jgi:AcrR family transcriptional regulator
MIQDIADEAGVVSTAVYYHFEGKADLFDACIARVWQSLDKATAQARPEDDTLRPDSYLHVIDAAWSWVERYPDAATLLYLHTPGATPRSRLLHEAQLERHMHRAFDYLETTSPPRTRRQASILHATHSLALRTLLSLVIGIHPLRMKDGPLSDLPAADVRQALQAAALRLLEHS